MSELERRAEYEKCWGVRAITRESFLAAYVDAHRYVYCETAAADWNTLHTRAVLGGEIDEDP